MEKGSNPKKRSADGKTSADKKAAADKKATPGNQLSDGTPVSPERPEESGDGASSFPLVAIGASAGGLEAILQLLEHLPAHTGAIFVVLQHLSANHESILPELLERKSPMKVRRVENEMSIQADQVYVIPPNVYLSLMDGRFALSPRGKSEDGFHVIDHFLSAIAPVYQNKAIAVILSGTAADGTAGVRSIKAEGGITFAQDDSARFQSMPRNAIESGYIDFVLPPERIAAELQNIVNGLYKNELRVENIANKEDELRKIHLLLLKKHDVDFSLYKQTTIIRRIIRRMSLNRINSLDQYVRLLNEDGREIDLLHRDLLINVTSFFREPALYTALSKRIFPALLKDRRPIDPIRIWIPACATGEEPYSIAICFFEYLKDKAINTPIQIFATDLSEAAINKARAGIYGKNTLVNVSPQRLRKYFVKVDGNYQIIKPIRDICIFATHNLLKDPPFSRMDLISCQNVLIYMEQTAQKKIMQAFNYALKPSKYLVLGKSETIGSSTDLFDQLDKDLRIYSRKSAPANMHFDFSFRSQSYMPGIDLKDEKNFISQPTKEVDAEKEAEKLMLSLYMPASILVNKDLQILRFYGAAFPYLQPASGKASLHLLKMIRDELIFELRTLIKTVKKDGKGAKKERVQLPDNGQLRDITIEVQPIKTSPDPHMLIVFQPSPIEPPSPVVKRAGATRQEEKDRRIIALEKEIKEAREHVKSITEDFEATREELQSANEEVLSSNEELQSINEELETSKEELQSTNEELITINEELQLRNNELKEAFDYSKAIIETIREPLMVLNTDLRVLTVNHAFNSIFKLGPEEAEGNFLFDIGSGMFDLPVLREQLKKMVTKNTWLQDFELEHVFTGLGNKNLLLNAMRLNGEPGKRARILLAIEDTTEGSEAKKALVAGSEELRATQTSLRLALDAAQMGVWDLNLQTYVLKRSDRFDQLMRYDESQSYWDLAMAQRYLVEEDKKLLARDFEKFEEQGYIRFEGRVEHLDGIRWILLSGKVFLNAQGNPDRAAGVVFDITDQKTLEKQKDEFIGVASHELKTPVTSIQTYADLLMEMFERAGDKASFELMDKLRLQTERLAFLIRDLLDVTRISAGNMQLQPSVFDLNELIGSLADDMQRTTVDHRLVLELQPSKLEIRADRDRIGQVLNNLISNAAKFSPKTETIVVSSFRDADSFKIAIRDPGLGIPPEIQNRIFERFFRWQDDRITSAPGLGLGLYISAEILRRHGGSITVKSDPGQGSTFTVTLPLTANI